MDRGGQPSDAYNYADRDFEREALAGPVWKEDEVGMGDERPQSPEEPALMKVETVVVEDPEA